MIKKILVLIILFVFSQNIFSQQIGNIKLEDLISKENQIKMGLNKLNKIEKENLRKHLINLLMQAFKKGYEEGLKTNNSITTYQGIGSGHWIQKNIDSGSFILLEDNSLWQIDPIDKVDAMLWLPTSNITVIESSDGTPGYDYLLINTDDGEKAHAKYIKK